MGNQGFPAWVPDIAVRYMLHTELGHSIRDIARNAGCHPSTVLRQIRKMEIRRDDPAVEAILAALATRFCADSSLFGRETKKLYVGEGVMKGNSSQVCDTAYLPEDATFRQDAARVLRRLCENGAVLAIAKDMEKAVVVRDDNKGGGMRTAVVEVAVANAMALNEWIACDAPGRISRYRITAHGRAALSQMVNDPNDGRNVDGGAGFSEAPAAFSGASKENGVNSGLVHSFEDKPQRYTSSESPLIALARRKDKNGEPFLHEALVRAGERLREDFEIAQMEPGITANWDHFLTAGTSGHGPSRSGPHLGPSAARDRVARALSDLGPGLSDVALRCCCLLEGLETAERRLGWSARSGKIVLRIALQRLRRHYDEASEQDRLIG